jgi:hypothetical protein
MFTFDKPFTWLIIIVINVLMVYLFVKIVKSTLSKPPSYTSSISTQASSNQPYTPSPVSPPTTVNPFYTQAFNQAVATAQAGNKFDAYIQLKSLQKDNPSDINLILWLVFTAPNLDEAKKLIGMAKFMDPSSASVKQAEEWLAGQMSKPL